MSERGIGDEIFELMEALFPICRSITGNGVRETLRIIGERIPLRLHEVPSGTPVFDWTVPREWNVREAYVEGPGGRRVVDFRECNLHVLNYSVPMRAVVSLDELKKHLFTLPEHPDWIPYKTSYYAENWGFCLSHNQLLSLQPGDYLVVIDSTLTDGSLSYAECYVAGESDDEILVSTHICHPSLANDNLSGIGIAVFLARHVMSGKTRHSYRFLFAPGTIGAITWLAANQASTARIRHGLVLSGLGDPGAMTYKKSRRGDAEIDRVVQAVLGQRDPRSRVLEFTPYGYDERQYCSPGFNLPVGRLSRTPYGEYDQYHTSGDNLDFVSAGQLGEAFSIIAEVLETLEGNDTCRNLHPMCEPQLGKRGLYDQPGPQQLAMLWVLNLSDGEHSLLDIAQRSGIPFQTIRAAAGLLRGHGLID